MLEYMHEHNQYSQMVERFKLAWLARGIDAIVSYLRIMLNSGRHNYNR